MGSNFKYVVTGIICCLCIVFFFQLFWLKGLYNTINSETEKEILECLEIANVDELQCRMDSLESSNQSEEKTTISISQTIESDDEETGKERTHNKQVIQGEDTVYSHQQKEEADLDIKEIEQVFSALREAIHQTIDSLAPINLNVIDSSLVASFESKNIKSRLYQIDVVSLSTDSVILSKKGIQDHKNAQTFTYIYDSANSLGYRIHVEPLTKTVLLQMSGILITTVLIIIILSFAFWYLIKTVMRQKTLEQMKDDFTNNMTHELKTPIAVAYSAADTLLNFKQGENKERRDQYLAICKEQLSELSGLVEQILSMSMERRQTFVLNKEDILVRDMIDNLVTQHQLKSDKEITFNMRINPEDIVIYADRTHLNNVLSNLMDNAVKYSKESVTIDIHIYQQDQYNIIEIKDNGVGIPSEKQAYIFDKFYRVTHGNKYSTKGYGLGLFYVKTMVEKHGGTISVHSSVHKGSTFTIKILQ